MRLGIDLGRVTCPEQNVSSQDGFLVRFLISMGEEYIELNKALNF